MSLQSFVIDGFQVLYSFIKLITKCFIIFDGILSEMIFLI